MWILTMRYPEAWRHVTERFLVVDAAQGVEAQTLANVYLALDHDLDVMPVINKIDLPSAQPDRCDAGDRGCDRNRSAWMRRGFLQKPDSNIDQVLEQIVREDPGTDRRSGCTATGADF